MIKNNSNVVLNLLFYLKFYVKNNTLWILLQMIQIHTTPALELF